MRNCFGHGLRHAKGRTLAFVCVKVTTIEANSTLPGYDAFKDVCAVESDTLPIFLKANTISVCHDSSLTLMSLVL